MIKFIFIYIKKKDTIIKQLSIEIENWINITIPDNEIQLKELLLKGYMELCHKEEIHTISEFLSLPIYLNKENIDSNLLYSFGNGAETTIDAILDFDFQEEDYLDQEYIKAKEVKKNAVLIYETASYSYSQYKVYKCDDSYHIVHIKDVIDTLNDIEFKIHKVFEINKSFFQRIYDNNQYNDVSMFFELKNLTDEDIR